MSTPAALTFTVLDPNISVLFRTGADWNTYFASIGINITGVNLPTPGGSTLGGTFKIGMTNYLPSTVVVPDLTSLAARLVELETHYKALLLALAQSGPISIS